MERWQWEHRRHQRHHDHRNGRHAQSAERRRQRVQLPQLQNHGTVNWHAGNIRAGNGSSFSNSGHFYGLHSTSAQIDAPGKFGGSFTFVNHGTYHKNGSGTTVVDVPFTNSGAIQVAAGQLQFSSSFTQNSGTLNLTNGATLKFDQGLNLTSGTRSGSGNVIGTVTSSATLAPGNSPGPSASPADLRFSRARRSSSKSRAIPKV